MSENGFSPSSVFHSPFSVTFDLDAIVRQIMVDLTVTDKPVSADAKNISKIELPPDIKENTEKPLVNEIYIDSRVVSLAELSQHLGNATKLFISPKSILTPSAKDEIRKRKLEVAVKLPLPSVRNAPAIWFAFHKPAIFPVHLLNLLQKEIFLKQESFVTLTELLNEAERQLSDEKNRAVALTRQSATAIHLANQRNIIRAIGCVDPKQSLEDTVELNANLLVIHPERVSNTKIFEIVKQLQKF
ncbi:MAG: hypothetical protein LBG58_05595 [Planctomycetaceae bacterium]|jgi:hypothetical protein|nr:hypothetical protein [Planctomycetaceae bacterium]